MNDLDELRSELDDFAQPAKKGGKSALEERVIAGFEEIQRFVDKCIFWGNVNTLSGRT